MKKSQLILELAGAVLIVALFSGLFFFLGRFYGEVKHPENPDSSIIVKDSIESKLWKSKYDSVTTEYKRIQAMYTRIKSQTQKIDHENEINKQRALSANDSTALFIRDSLRTRYAELIDSKTN